MNTSYIAKEEEGGRENDVDGEGKEGKEMCGCRKNTNKRKRLWRRINKSKGE
jgi:hypothetical protein